MKYLAMLNVFKRLPTQAWLVLAGAIGGFVAWLMPPGADWEIRVLCVWDIGILILLSKLVYTLLPCSPEQTRLYARSRQISSTSVFTLAVLTACISIFVVGLMLTDSRDTPPPFREIQIWLSLAAIICSWLLTHLMFMLHYAHIYYTVIDASNPNQYGGGLQFPNEEYPDYLDFMYFAFTIGMTSQTSDILVSTRPMRRLVLLHAIVSFFFYAVILATTINTIASLF